MDDTSDITFPFSSETSSASRHAIGECEFEVTLQRVVSVIIEDHRAWSQRWRAQSAGHESGRVPGKQSSSIRRASHWWCWWRPVTIGRCDATHGHPFWFYVVHSNDAATGFLQDDTVKLPVRCPNTRTVYDCSAIGAEEGRPSCKGRDIARAAEPAGREGRVCTLVCHVRRTQEREKSTY